MTFKVMSFMGTVKPVQARKNGRKNDDDDGDDDDNDHDDDDDHDYNYDHEDDEYADDCVTFYCCCVSNKIFQSLFQ